MAELTRRSWDEVTALPVLEFLNLLCYRADKMKEKERQEREWLRRH